MESHVLTESDVHWIVEIFSKSGDLVLNRNRLYFSLGLTVSQLEDINITVDRDRSHTHGFLVLGLTKWVNINRSGATIGKLIQVLRNQEFNSVADKISEELPKREGIPSSHLAYTIDPTSVWYDVPEKVSTFTGRTDEMERLHESITGQNVEGDERNEITVISTLSGLGGIGKTTLAIHYAWNYFCDKFYFNVIWINAETVDTVEKSFRGLAGKVGLGTTGNNRLTFSLIELASRIYEYFEQTSTLFIFDNVEQYDRVKPYLPIKTPKTRRQYVLITSRNREWNRKTDLIVLNVFPENDSVQFLKSYLKLKTDVEIELAIDISRGLQNLPLAIRQAGAYIDKVCSDDHLGAAQVMKIYLDLLHKDSKQVFGFKCDSYENTINSTWNITLKKIKRQNYLAVRIMRIISYFNSDNIPIQLLQNIPNKSFFKRVRDSMIYKNSSINESSVLGAVKLLSQFSMVTRDSHFNISVHRLVQKVIRDDVKLRFEYTILYEAVRAVFLSLLETMNGSDYEQNCLVHAMSAITYIQSNDLKPQYIKFIKFVTSKQKNSMEVHGLRLSSLLEVKRYDETEELFYKSRDEYFSEPNGERNDLTELFTLKFIIIVSEKIGTLDLIDFGRDREGEILRLSELCSKHLLGFKFPVDAGELDRDSFAWIAHSFKRAKNNTYLPHSIQRSLVGTAADMFGILFDDSITRRNFESVFEFFENILDCFSYLERWRDMLGMVESLFELSIEWSKSGNGQLMITSLRETCNQLYIITTRIVNLETNHDVQNKLFQAKLKVYNNHYTFFRQNEDYILTLQCGVGRIKCLTHMNKQIDLIDIVEVIGDMKLVLDLMKQAGINVLGFELLEVTESIITYSNLTYCTDIKTDLLECAVVILEMIFKSSIIVCKYNFFFLKTVILMLECLTQLNRISQMTNIWEQLKSFLFTISDNELDDEIRDNINKSFSKIENDMTEAFNLTEFTLQMFKFTFKFGIKINESALIDGGMEGILDCLEELDRRHEIISLADDLKIFLVAAAEKEYYGHFIGSLDSLFKMSKHPSCQDIRIDLLKSLLQSYQLIYTYGTSDSNFDYIRESAKQILNTLAELNETKTILETVSGISSNIRKVALTTDKSYVIEFFDSLVLISKHPNCAALKIDLLEIGLTNYKRFYDRCKKSGYNRDISKCMEGMLNYLIELNQTRLFIQYVSEEFTPFLANVREEYKIQYQTVIQMIDQIVISDLSVD